MKVKTRLLPAALGAALAAGVAGCSKSTPAAPSQPTTPATVTIAAPQLQSPTGGIQITGFRPTLVVKNAVVTGTAGTVTYHFEISETGDFPTGNRTVTVDNVPQGTDTTSWTVPVDLAPNFLYSWRARATNGTVTSGWSAVETVKTENAGFRNGQDIYDPLSNGKTVGAQIGGTFVPNQGWMALDHADAIDYDIPTMPAGQLEFDVLGVDPDEPGPYDIGQKFYCMGSADNWDFWGFRDGDFKASLDKKSGRVYDGESGVVEHIFRVGDDDNREKTGENDFDDQHTYHVLLRWGNGHVHAQIDDMVIADEDYSGEYAPADHRISLGCRPRTETLTQVIFSNVRIQPTSGTQALGTRVRGAKH